MEKTETVRLLHIADTHLRDTQFQLKLRGEDFAAALEDAARLAEESRADAVLLPGDMLDSTRPSSAVIARMRRLSDQLVFKGLPMLVTSGNHDQCDPHWVEAICPGELRGGMLCLDNKEFRISRPGQPDFVIRGLPFCRRDEFLASTKDMPRGDVLLWHGAVTGLASGPTGEQDVRLEDLPGDMFALIALGDQHTRNSATLPGGAVAAYPGSTELCSSDEPADKFADMYEFEVVGGRWRISAGYPRALRIRTRRAAFFQLLTDADMDKALQEIRDLAPSDPIVLVRYNRGLENARGRLSTAMAAGKGILRAVPLPEIPADRPGVDKIEDRKLPDFLARHVPAGSPVHALGLSLLDPAADEQTAYDTFAKEMGIAA